MILEKNWFPNPNNMRKAFVNWYNEHVHDFDVDLIYEGEVYVVWFCYTLGNAKALISTVRQDHMYYELTWNDRSQELYVDQYTKVNHYAIARE